MVLPARGTRTPTGQGAWDYLHYTAVYIHSLELDGITRTSDKKRKSGSQASCSFLLPAHVCRRSIPSSSHMACLVLSRPTNNNTTRQCVGPNTPTPEAFAEALFTDTSTWAVTDRGRLEAMVPVTKLLLKAASLPGTGTDDFLKKKLEVSFILHIDL